MKKTTHCSECKTISECTYSLGEFICKKCLIELDEEEDYCNDEDWPYDLYD